jgi:tetratricopeptide (TPR) repeat protein
MGKNLGDTKFDVEAIIDKVMDRLTLQFKVPGFYFSPNIPEKKKAGAMGSYVHLTGGEEILCLYDSTVFGGAKEGICLTNQAIYWKAIAEAGQSVRYEEIASVTVKGKNLYINDKQVESCPAFNSIKTVLDRIVGEKDTQPPARQSTPPVATAPVETSVKVPVSEPKAKIPPKSKLEIVLDRICSINDIQDSLFLVRDWLDTESLAEIERLAQKNNENALYFLGICCMVAIPDRFYKVSIPQNLKMAKELFDGSEAGLVAQKNLNNANAQYKLHHLYSLDISGISRMPNPAKANQCEKRAVELFTPDAERGDLYAILHLAEIYHTFSGEHKKSEYWYQIAAKQLENETDNGVFLYKAADIYESHLKNKDKAVELFKKAARIGNKSAPGRLKWLNIDFDPDDPEGYCERGNDYIERGKYDEAIGEFNKEILCNPKNSYAYLCRSEAYAGIGRNDEAIVDCGTAIQIVPDYFAAYRRRGGIYVKIGRFDEAIRDCSQAIEWDSEDALSYCYRGLAYTKIENYSRAVADYNKAVELDHYSSKKVQKIREELENALWPSSKEPDPDTDATEIEDSDTFSQDIEKDYYACFERGIAYAEHYDKAIVEYTKAIQLMPRISLAYDLRGDAYVEAKRYDEAIRDYSTAIGLDPKDSKLYNKRGDAYCHVDCYAEAFNDYTAGDPDRSR